MNSSHTAQTGLLRRFLDRLYLLGGNLAALCVLAILVLMIAASVGRVSLSLIFSKIRLVR